MAVQGPEETKIRLTPQKLPNSALSSGSKKNPTLSCSPKKYVSKIKKSLSRNYLISPICNNIKFTHEQSGHYSMLSLNSVYKMKVPADKLPIWWDSCGHHRRTYMRATAATAKSLQSCPTLCDPTDGSPSGSPVPGILQARTLEWVAISFSNAWKGKVKVKSLSCIRLLATPWTVAYQAPPTMGFSRQEYWSGVPLPSPHESY